MPHCLGEPPIEELLNDPIARLLMASDRVEMADLHALLNALRTGRRRSGSGAADGAVPPAPAVPTRGRC